MLRAALNAEVRDYDARVFQRLNEFHLARDYLEDKRESLTELGDVICRHGLHQRVGVSLLHKHFEISENEPCASSTAMSHTSSPGTSTN